MHFENLFLKKVQLDLYTILFSANTYLNDLDNLNESCDLGVINWQLIN